MHHKSPEKPKREDDEALFRKLVLPEEDKAHRTSTGWRWFKSPNVIDLVRILRERGKLRNRAE